MLQDANLSGPCSIAVGTSRIVLVAPHGGRRAGPPPVRGRTAKVNDLHTADLALQLAKRVGASFVVNTSIDRNDLDLNRISQVGRRAPWLFRALDSILAEVLSRHATALVFFIHGWNVVQPRCDTGVGDRLGDEWAAERHGDRLTAAPAFVVEDLTRFRLNCARRGIHVTYGDRYPAKHPNNLLQLFRSRPDRTPPESAHRLASWSSAGRIHAAQLELGIPLRWPGRTRAHFEEAFAETFADSRRGRPSPPPRRVAAAGTLAAPCALQLYDGERRFGLLGAVTRDRAGRSVGGRLLLFPGDGRVALFVGEDADEEGLAGDGPRFTPREDGFRFAFDGLALESDDGHRYFDFEHGLATSGLRRFAVDLRFRGEGGGAFGRAFGEVHDGDRAWRIDCEALSHPLTLDRSARIRSSHLALTACLEHGTILRVCPGDGTAGATLRTTTRRTEERIPLASVRIDLRADLSTPSRISLRLPDGRTVVGEPLDAIVVRRPLAAGRAARVTLGALHLREHGAHLGYGFYEYARLLRPPVGVAP